MEALSGSERRYDICSGCSMLVEIAKPIALTLCMISLYAVFHAAFMVPASDLSQKIVDSLELLALAAGIALIGGMIFRDSAAGQRLMATLPVQVFCWGAGLMFILFVVSWYLENNCYLCRDPR